MHVIASDEVYPTREHCRAKWLVHAGRVTAGIYDRNRLPAIDDDDLAAVAQMLEENSSGDKVSSKRGRLHIHGLPIP